MRFFSSLASFVRPVLGVALGALAIAATAMVPASSHSQEREPVRPTREAPAREPAAAPATEAAEPVFSGPQVGEVIAPLEVQLLVGESAGKKQQLAADAGEKPLLIIFVHEVNRPAIGLARVLINYAETRQADGLDAALVFLSADRTFTEDWAKRASGVLPNTAPTGVSLDGIEGPGAWGLNRNVQVTIVLANKKAVVGNWALVQPGLATDAPPVLAAICKQIGGEPPALEKLLEAPMRGGRGEKRETEAKK